MRSRTFRIAAGLALLLVASGCTGGDDAADSSTSSTGGTAATTSTTQAPSTSSTTTTLAPEPTTTTSSTTTTTVATVDLPRARQGDRNETVEAIQFLLNCNGFGELTVDGVFGPGTRTAVEAAQTSLGLTVDGVVGENTIAALSRSCDEDRRIDGDGESILVGHVSPDDPELFPVALVEGSTVVATIPDGPDFVVTLTGADGTEVAPLQGTASFEAPTSQDYVLSVASATEVTFAMTLVVTLPEREAGDWILDADGITYRGTELGLGDDADTVIDNLFDFLGHGVRGAYDEFDTGWYEIDDPQPIGLRGVLIEGLAFLFFGPHATGAPNRAETLDRIRFEGPSDNADGNPRPANYVTTAEGITVGNTLTDLLAAYGTSVRSGSNDEEYYYRLARSGGELCFYFGAEEPDDLSPITEMATECRS